MSKRERKSLLSNSLLTKNLVDSRYTDIIPSSNGETTDDCEWEMIQKNIDELNEEMEENAIDFLDFKTIEDGVLTENIEESLDAKEKEVNTVQKQAEEIALRFIWDLSLALKKLNVQKVGATTSNGIKMANVKIQSIIDQTFIDQPHPDNWETWIKQQYDERCDVQTETM